MTKKYYWLKLKADFFEDDTITFIEEQPNGIYYSNFYLKLCLKSLKNDGYLFRLVGETLMPYDPESLAKLTGVDVDTVRVAMELFRRIGLVKILDSGEIYLTQINEMVGSETDSAQRMRRMRAKDQVKGIASQCDTEIEKELETELDTRDKRAEKKKESTFKKPSIEDVEAYCMEHNYSVDAGRFIDYYTANGWKVGRNPMKDWKAAVRGWESRDKGRNAKTRHNERMSGVSYVGAF